MNCLPFGEAYNCTGPLYPGKHPEKRRGSLPLTMLQIQRLPRHFSEVAKAALMPLIRYYVPMNGPGPPAAGSLRQWLNWPGWKTSLD